MISNLPLLAFAPKENQRAIIEPDFERLSFTLPKRACLAFLSDRTIQTLAEEKQARLLGYFVSIQKKFPVYSVTIEGHDVAFVQAPVGAPAAVLILERLFAYGAESCITAGCCGALTDLPENHFLIIDKAFRDEGTSFQYLPPSDAMTLDPAPQTVLAHVLDEKEIPHVPCTVWSTDGFFRETKEKICYAIEKGCTAIDMECAALAACASFRQKQFGALLFTADTLHAYTHDIRHWGAASRTLALDLALTAASRL